MKIVVVGGGWAGCAAALMARRQGASVDLLERTDLLLGTGLVGGIMRNNGRFTVTEECIALGFGELFELIDQSCRHINIEFPGHQHASLYDIAKMPQAVETVLMQAGVNIYYRTRVTQVQMDGQRLQAALTQDNRAFPGDVFIDTTGTAGPMQHCTRYGNGCAMCVLRCPSFGGRVSLTALAGVPETYGAQKNGSPGAMSGSCKLMKESLSPEIVAQLNKAGVVIIPLPQELQEDHLAAKACQQYALAAFRENIILLDTGHAKLMAPFFPLNKLHRVPGFENARYEDPYAGGQGNSMRFFAVSPRNDALQVLGVKNLFCAGEKSGLLVGHTEAIATGALAGYNAVQVAFGAPCLILPISLALGESIRFVRMQTGNPSGLSFKYTFSGSILFDHLKTCHLYTVDRNEIKLRVERAKRSMRFSF